MTARKESRWTLDAVPKRILIYILSGYVLLQFVWWAYMLVELNGEIYGLRLEMLTTSGIPAPEELILKGELDGRLSKRIWMVLGEGAVFMVILVLGFRAVQRSVVRELQLAAQQRNFLLSVTHELKSPLAAIRLQLQTLAGRELPEEKRQQIYSRALSDTDRLQGLVENLLLVNRVEAGRFPVHLEETDLSALVQQICESHFHSQMTQSVVRVSLMPDLMVRCDRSAMRSIVVNLVENALKYAVGSPVEVRLSWDGHGLVLTVADEGPGIPMAERERIFHRFFRLGNEDTRSTKGTGIGLYLVRQLVEMQGGAVTVTDNRPQGARFEVRIP
ncbi:MAG: HAMP domain-containing histidine kinase [Flavobacteriales bacterium]|nr:HAMP domain-containing histidine kinase [Flavobacteriales bacterium]